MPIRRGDGAILGNASFALCFEQDARDGSTELEAADRLLGNHLMRAHLGTYCPPCRAVGSCMSEDSDHARS
jgi:hypothetical protein